MQAFTENMNGILCVFAVVIAVAMSVPADERAVRASAKVLLKLHKVRESGIFLPFQNRDPGPIILGKIMHISVKLGKWIQNRTGDNMHIWC